MFRLSIERVIVSRCSLYHCMNKVCGIDSVRCSSSMGICPYLLSGFNLCCGTCGLAPSGYLQCYSQCTYVSPVALVVVNIQCIMYAYPMVALTVLLDWHIHLSVVLGDSICRLGFLAEQNKAEPNTMSLLSTTNLEILQLSNLSLAH
jgi:hypothetical protein